MLTETSVRALQATVRRFFVWCDDTRGLDVRVGTGGSKSLVFKYSHGGQQALETIGPWPGVKLEAARKWIQRRRAELLGVERPEEPETPEPAAPLPTWADLWAVYEPRAAGEVSEGEMQNRRSAWKCHLAPALVPALPVAELNKLLGL